MAKANIHFPSKMFQYGVLEFEFEVPDDATPSELGELYARRVLEFRAAEIDAFEAAREAAATKTESPTPSPVREAEAKQLIETELGGKVVAEETAPWDEPAPPKAEPWKIQPVQNVKPWEGPIPSFDFENN